jgi:hypothetical protein
MAFRPEYVKKVGPRVRIVVDDSNCIVLEIGEDGVQRERETLTRAGVLSEVLREALRIQKLRDDELPREDAVFDYASSHDWAVRVDLDSHG